MLHFKRGGLIFVKARHHFSGYVVVLTGYVVGLIG